MWALAYLYSPYWHAFGTFGFPNLKYVAFVFLLFFGLLWAYLSASDLKLPKIRIHAIPIILLSLCLYVVNFRPLNADIPWRGDEDFHINLILQLVNYFDFFWTNKDIYLLQNPLFWIFLLLILIFASLMIINRLKINIALKRAVRIAKVSIGILLIPFLALVLFPENAFGDQRDIFLLSDILRYPFIQKWANFFFVVPNFYEISLYRIVPFLSLIGISFFLFYNFYQQLRSTLLAFLFAFAFSTAPIFLFYSSILYLEMPIIFLMIVSTFNLKTIIKEDSKKLKLHYVWYVLLLTSFLKETAIIFLFLLMLLRMVYQLFTQQKSRGIRNLFFSESKLSFSIFIPSITYLFIRYLFLSEFGDWAFYTNNILSIANYRETAQSLVLQIGMVSMLALLGLFYFGKKERIIMVVVSVLFVGILGFFLSFLSSGYIDDQGKSLLAGYSRWNLYLIPMILFTASIFVIHIVKIKRIYSFFLLIVIFMFNIILFPFKIDGARLPNWNSPHMDTAEYTYPYDEAIRFLSTQNHIDSLLLLGQYSKHWGLRFYFEKYNFHPKVVEYYFGSTRFDDKIERQMFDLSFDKLLYSADTILYHSVNNIDLNMNIVYGGRYKIVKRVQNSLHSLYILHAL